MNDGHLLLLASALLAVPAAAQDAPEVVVTGRGLASAPGERAYDTVVIDRAAIESDAANRLETVLGRVAGLDQFRRSDSRSANPTSQGITLRGLGGNAASRALLILDGVPQADPFGGWVAFPAYALSRLGEVRVTRGGGSGLYGAGALAGTVVLESATPDQLAPLSAEVAGGSRGSLDAQGTAALVRPGGFLTATAAYARGDGFVPTVAEDRGPVDRASPYAQASAAVRAVVRSGATEVQANLSAFTDARERGTAYSAIRSRGADASLRLVGHGRWGWSLLGYVQTRDFANQFPAINAARTSVTPTLDQYATPATGLGARVEVAPSIGGGADLRVGGDMRALSGRTEELYGFAAGTPTRRRVAGGRTLTAGGFADASAVRGPVTFSLGGRVDAWRISDGRLKERAFSGGLPLTDLSFPDRHGTEASGRAGAAWRVTKPLTLRAAGYRGWRLPTLNELFRSYRVGADATAANAVLTPEHLWGGEAGADWTPIGRVKLSATLFDNRLTGAIANVTMGQRPGTYPLVGLVAAGGAYRVRENLDAIRARGAEVDARWAAGAWSLSASYAHTASRVEASGAAAGLNGLRPAQTPLDQALTTIGWAGRGAALSATLRYVAAQFDDDQNTRRLAPATTLDARAAVPVGRGWSVELRSENISDTRVETGTSGANVIERATPRTLWLGVIHRER